MLTLDRHASANDNGRDHNTTAVTFARNVSKIGHWGNGNVELAINDLSRLHDAESFISKSFDAVSRA